MELGAETLDLLGDFEALLQDLAVLDGHGKSLDAVDSLGNSAALPEGNAA
jgi:hypothetical protein